MKFGLILDSNDQICETTGDWNMYIIQYQTDNCKTEEVIGESIFQFLQGELTKTWFESIFTFVRLLRKPVDFNYISFAKAEKHSWHAQIEPEINSHLSIKYQLITSLTHSNLISIIFDSKSRLKACYLCKQIYYNGTWKNIETISELSQNNLIDLKVFFSICEHCQQILNSKIRNSMGYAFSPRKGRFNHEPA